jgi:hypothetical protein
VDGEELPLAGDTLQGVPPSVTQRNRAGEDLCEVAGDQDLILASLGHDSRRGVHRETAHLLAPHLDVTNVQASPDLEPQRAHGGANRTSTMNGRRRAVERGKERVAGGVTGCTPIPRAGILRADAGTAAAEGCCRAFTWR